MKIKLLAKLVAFFLLLPYPCIADDGYRLAVYYYPGWKDGAEGLFASKPWDLIKPYPEREPLLGWYKEGEVSVMSQHLKWMKQYGINQVVFDWYWDGVKNLPYLSHALDAYFAAPNRSDVGFAIHWANHRPFPLSKIQFDRMVQYWVANLFNESGYWYDNGEPVVFIFSADLLEKSAAQIGTNTRALLDRANELAQERGLSGIKFVVNSNAGWGSYGPKLRGYSTLTGYVYQRAFSGKVEPLPGNYGELTKGYETMWSWIIENTGMEYWPPVVFGWDKRPWGGVNAEDTCCENTPKTFENHMSKAKALLDTYPLRTKRTLLICCWNEFGEGNYIEPTKKNGFTYLEIVKDIFRARRKSVDATDP